PMPPRTDPRPGSFIRHPSQPKQSHHASSPSATKLASYTPGPHSRRCTLAKKITKRRLTTAVTIRPYICPAKQRRLLANASAGRPNSLAIPSFSSLDHFQRSIRLHIQNADDSCCTYRACWRQTPSEGQ
ncbi:hypothetical protein BN1723_003334, partial [Verticillium longisporum]